MEDWQRTLRVLWLVQFLTTLAMNLGLTFVPFFLVDDPVLRVEDNSERILYTGLILAGPFATTIVFTPFWGWMADRTGPKRQVVRACLGLALTQLLMAVAQSPAQMVAIRMLQGAVSGVLAASLGLLAVVTPAARQGRALAALQSATPAGQILGPVLGGVLATALGFRTTYAILGTMILAAGVVAWALLRQHNFVPTESTNPFSALLRTARRAVSQPVLRRPLITFITSQFAFTISQGVFAIYAGKLIDDWVQTNGITPAWWNSGIAFTALAMTMTGIASVSTASAWGHIHDGRKRRVTPIGAALLAGSMLILFLTPPWWVVLLARLGVGAGIAAMTLPFAAISAATVPEERNQQLSLATSVTHLGNLAGFLVGGVLAGWWSEIGNFALAAAVYVAIAMSALRRRSSAAVAVNRGEEYAESRVGEPALP